MKFFTFLIEGISWLAIFSSKLHNGIVPDSKAANLGAKLIVEVLPTDELLKKAGVPEAGANNELVKHLAKEGTEEALKPVVENVVKNVKN
jgi:hypothetical protein